MKCYEHRILQKFKVLLANSFVKWGSLHEKYKGYVHSLFSSVIHYIFSMVP